MGACGGAQAEPSQPAALPSATAASTSSAPVATATAPTTATTSSTIAVVDASAPVAASDAGARSPELVIMAMRGDLRRCYTRALKSDPNMRAALRLTIEVAPDGSVTKVTPHSTPPIASDFEQCLVAAASKVAFDPPGGSGATFELPINLVPANP